MPDDARVTALRTWLDTVTPRAGYVLSPASVDASFRRYFRLDWPDTGDSLIAMDAPPKHEDCRPFLRIARQLRRAGLRAPAVLASDLPQGFMLLSDLGNTTYLSALDDDTADALYTSALEALVRVQKLDTEGLPPFDASLLRSEMALFEDWLLRRHLDLTPPEPIWRKVQDMLVESALSQPQVYVHRDYHSRNLMVCDADSAEPFAPPLSAHSATIHSPGLLDFQDAVKGPLTYDLVSLLKDCYVSWPADRVETWLRHYAERARAAGLAVPDDLARLFARMGAQRHLKAAGIFARLYHRDGKAGYLGDLPRTLGYITALADVDDDLAPFATWVRDAVHPALAKAPGGSL